MQEKHVVVVVGGGLGGVCAASTVSQERFAYQDSSEKMNSTAEARRTRREAKEIQQDFVQIAVET